MLERVGQALLDDAVGREVDRGREREAARPRRAACTGRPARPTSSSSASSRSRPGLRGELDVLAVGAHRAEQAAHLGQRRAAGLLDAPQRVAVLRERLGEPVPDGADLEHHHADRVGDDVVELACDPRALLGDGDARRRLALPLGLRGAQPPPPPPLGPLAQREAGQPGDREQDRR